MSLTESVVSSAPADCADDNCRVNVVARVQIDLLFPRFFILQVPFVESIPGLQKKAIKLNSGAIVYRAQMEISGNEIR